MKVMMIVWIAALSIAYLVAGRSFEQALLSGKIVLIGFVLGYVGSKLSATLHAYRDAKSAVTSFRR
ncbi:MAG: hypothetical protein FD131_4778 [Rhodocyclaceae bacterium]|nr:MAG: hypothetical protein FD131_4778 [Rhodocyclaceae bacterium]